MADAMMPMVRFRARLSGNRCDCRALFAGVVSALPDGGFIVAQNGWWPLQDNRAFGLLARRYNGAGTKQGDAFLVNTTNSGKFQNAASIATLADGGFIVTWLAASQDSGFVVAWESEEQDGSGRGIFAQRFDENGVPDGAG